MKKILLTFCMTFLIVCVASADRGTLLPPIVGPSPVTVGGTFTYEYDPGVVVFNPYWNIGTLGTVQSTWVIGTTYYISVTWHTNGSAPMKFYEDGGLTQLASKTVTINVLPTPATTFTTNQKCGSTVVKRTTAPGDSTYDWWWQTSSTGTVTTLGSADSVVRTTAGALYLRARTKASPYSWSTAQSVGTIAVQAAPPSAPAGSTDGNLISNSGGVVTLTVQAVSGASGYAWYDQASGGNLVSGQTTVTYLPNLTQTKSFYVTALVGSCASTSRRQVTGNIFPEPVITGTNGTNIVMGQPTTLLVSNLTYTTYQWLTAAGAVIPGQTSASMPVTTTGTFKIRVTKNTSAPFTSAIITVGTGVDGQNMNYVVSRTLLTGGVTSESVVPTLPVDSVKEVIQYFDGLGRPVQTVSTQSSPLKFDFVQPKNYDEFGREKQTYLPYISAARSGSYNLSPFGPAGNYTSSPQYIFYNNGATDKVADDTKPYAETVFEASTLNRVIKQGAPGIDWQPDATATYASIDHTQKMAYEFNASNEVLKWTYTLPDATYLLGFPEAGTNTARIYYAPGTLFKSRIKDENNNEVIEFKDKSGRVVLKKIQVTSSLYAETYYVYDDYGSLVWVLPPEAMKLVTKSTSDYFSKTLSVKNVFLTTWAFGYAYDARRSMSHKKVPAGGIVYMVYDKRDRLVMTQDAVQRSSNQWTFTKYDALNRPVITGIYTHGSAISQSAMSALFSSTNFSEVYNGAVPHGYSNSLFPTSGTVLTVTYYDNYNFITPIFNGGISGITTYNYQTGDLTGQEISATSLLTGQVTGARVNILGSSTYLNNVVYYDSKNRPIQVINQNHKGGIDRVTNLYDFVKVVQTKTIHANGSNTYTAKRRITYDHAGRVKQIYHTFNTEPEVLINENGYNELGELVTKKNHSRAGSNFLQTTDYLYTIRGWTKQINDPVSPEVSDLFSMSLRYTSNAPNNAPAQFNGGINEVVWQSAGQDLQAYEYYYDTLTRLKEARYFNKIRASLDGRYNELVGGVNAKGYDLNGNIRKLSRYGKKDATTFGLMDNLTYTYTGNQVTQINDAVTNSTVEEGFQELVEGANEYTYNTNGAMTLDNNEGITGITYNHLNLPVQINKGSTNYIVYTYDATGRKIRQQVYGATPKITDYVGEFTYENDTLKFINHEEGRIVPDNSAGAPRPWEYQYMLKDHLGNVRVMFSEKKTSSEYKATLETATQTTEQSTFKGYGNRSSFSPYNHTASGTYSQLLNAGSNGQVGLSKSFAVNPGDVLDLEVFAKYESPTSTSTSVSTLLNALVSTFALGTGTGAESPQAQTAFGAVFSGGSPFITSSMWDSGAPRAYLNYILFDQNFNLIDFGFDQVSTTAASNHELLMLHVKVQQKGYLYVYLSNEQAVQTNVYFDDFKINYHTGVEQVVNYYAFGLQQSSNSFQRQSAIKNPYLYNGKEIQDELNIGWLDYGARMYLPEIGRWNALDPLSDKFEIVSPYNYAYNNPLLFVDPTGMENIIYVVLAGKMTNKEAQNIVDQANTFLKGLGLKTEVKLFDEKVNGKFDVRNMDPTDNFAVLGDSKRAVKDKMKSLNSDFGDYLNDNWNGTAWPELTPSSVMGDGNGVAVDASDVDIAKKTEGKISGTEQSAWCIIHGAGHGAEAVSGELRKAETVDDHTLYGVMMPAWLFISRAKQGQPIFTVDQNTAYIKAMQQRYGTEAAKDNYKANQARRDAARQKDK